MNPMGVTGLEMGPHGWKPPIPGSPSNGRQIIKIGSKGKRWFQIGDREPFEIDAIMVFADWLEIRRQLSNDKGEVPPESMPEFNARVILFVQSVCGKEGQPDTTIDLGEALGFLKCLADVNTEMMPFFVPRPSEGQSSHESTRVIYSE